jgi:MFS family permease
MADSWGTGFDSSLMSAMNSSDRWHSDLGVPTTGSLLGIVTAIYTIGNMVGSFVAGPAGDRWGRKVGMLIGNTITLVGAIVLFSAGNYHAFLAGRFLTGFGLSISRSSAPSWVAEMSPPQWRGPAVMLYNSLWLIGAIIASAIAFASGPIQSSLSWRLPLILQVVPTSIVLLGVWFLPESPRWLIANDRLDDARRILTKYHADGDENSSLVSLEIVEMQDSIKLEASDKRWYDYSEFVTTRGNRYRLFMVISMGVIGII